MQSIVTTFNLMSQSANSMMTNPKFLSSAFWYGFLIFGSYHMTKTSIAMLSTTFMARFGRPQLVRETSKIATANFLGLPYQYSKKMILSRLAMTEANLLDGVILEK